MGQPDAMRVADLQANGLLDHLFRLLWLILNNFLDLGSTLSGSSSIRSLIAFSGSFLESRHETWSSFERSCKVAFSFSSKEPDLVDYPSSACTQMNGTRWIRRTWTSGLSYNDLRGMMLCKSRGWV